MSTKSGKSTAAAETTKAIIHLAAALKAPRITEAAARLADHARDSGWTHEDYLAASSNARSPPVTPPVPDCGSAPPASPRSRPSRTSTSTTNPPPAPPPRRWPPAPTWPSTATWSCSDHPGPARPT